MYGVMTAMMVFQSQLDEVESATPRERIGSGKISPIRTHAPGPQVEAKKKMYIAIKATCELTAETLLAMVAPAASRCVLLNPTVIPTIATMNWQMSMPNAPQIRRGRRPKRSIVQNETGVEHTLTIWGQERRRVSSGTS